MNWLLPGVSLQPKAIFGCLLMRQTLPVTLEYKQRDLIQWFGSELHSDIVFWRDDHRPISI
jgi:hypothetical protein